MPDSSPRRPATPGPRPRIALVTDAIGPYHRGGKEQRYQQLAQRLAARADVHVYTMHWWDGPKVRHDAGVTYHAISPLMPLYSGARRSILQAIVFALSCLRLLTRRFDVIEADHMPYLQLFTLKLVARIRRRRLVVTWHECWGPDYWQAYLGRPGRVGWLLEALAMRLPDTIIAASRETGERLCALTGGRVPVVVAPNGLDLEAIKAAEPAPRLADVVIVGRLLAHKRVDRLLEALSILKRAGREVTAAVVGTGPELEVLRRQAMELDVEQLVEFHQGVETQAQLYALIKAARAAVFPSEREGFGIAVLEALACGVPVITSSARDNLAQHLVRESGGAGIVCAPDANSLAEAIALVLDQPAAFKQGDGLWLRQYDWDAISHEVAGALA
jgi:glycosyltransferase involved in cell wall biosynthesis